MTPFICILLSALIIGSYLAVYLACVGQLPTSISDTYYQATKKWFFSATLISALAFAAPWLFSMTPESYQFLAFLIIAGLLFVAAAPAFREDFQSKVHICGAIVAGVACLAYLILEVGVPWIAIIITAVGVIDRKHWCFYLESGLIANLYVILFDKTLLHLVH